MKNFDQSIQKGCSDFLFYKFFSPENRVATATKKTYNKNICVKIYGK